jgi:regulator of Ty1 transposition protein 109
VRTPQASPRKLFGPHQTPGGSPSRANGEKKQQKKKKLKKKKLTGPIPFREPQVKTGQRSSLASKIPVSTPYYYWPAEGRGRRIVKEDGYKRSLELLLRLDFANIELAIGSTRRWINEVGLGSAWGLDVVGTRPLALSSSENGSVSQQPAISNLSGLVKRKKPTGNGETHGGSAILIPVGSADSAPAVNMLGASLVRKKRKPDDEAGPESSGEEPLGVVNGYTAVPASPAEDAPAINTLAAGLVRKKPKT